MSHLDDLAGLDMLVAGRAARPPRRAKAPLTLGRSLMAGGWSLWPARESHEGATGWRDIRDAAAIAETATESPSDVLPSLRRHADLTAPEDRILLAGGSAHPLDLLRLATIGSDDVVLMADDLDEATRRYAERFAVEWIRRDAVADDVPAFASLLVALDDVEDGNRLVRAARRSRIPVHVSGRPLVSDFSMLDFLERRPAAFAEERTS